MAKGDLSSPWQYVGGDYLYDQATANPVAPDHAVMVTVVFDNVTRVISSIQVWRAANCRFTKIVVGLGADGVPDSTTKKFNLAGLNDQSVTIPPSQYHGAPWNVNTIEDFINAGQITAAL